MKIFIECKPTAKNSIKVLTSGGEYAPVECWIKPTSLAAAIKAPRCFVIAETELQKHFATFWHTGQDPFGETLGGGETTNYVLATVRAVPVV